MSLELANHFQILRLKELVRQHQEFKEALFHSPVRIAVGIVVRGVVRPLRNFLRRSEILRRTAACHPPQQLEQVPLFIATRNDAIDANHVLFMAVPPHAMLATTLPAIHLESGNDRIIFVHAFYERESQIIFDRLDAYPDYDVVLTTAVPAIRDAFLARFDRHRAVCVEAPNQGRDILPFLLALNILDLQRYRYFIKIHTKRSAHLSDGGLWFRLNLEFLLGERTVSNAFFALLDADRPCLYGVESKPIQDHLENNRYWLEALLGRKMEQAQGQFIPGSMFMGTGVLLQRLVARRFDMYPMEAEDGQLDGTLAHALERYLGCLATDEGGECLAIESFLKKRGVA
jgi:lipopolysaccharide biosynthesis protein